MDIEDFFENKNRYHHKNKTPKYHADNNNYRESHNLHSQFNWFKLLNKISNNKRLKNLLIIGVILIIVIVITIIVVLFPFIIRVFNFILENGVSGLIQNGEDILNKLWNGSK